MRLSPPLSLVLRPFELPQKAWERGYPPPLFTSPTCSMYKYCCIVSDVGVEVSLKGGNILCHVNVRVVERPSVQKA